MFLREAQLVCLSCGGHVLSSGGCPPACVMLDTSDVIAPYFLALCTPIAAISLCASLTLWRARASVVACTSERISGAVAAIRKYIPRIRLPTRVVVLVDRTFGSINTTRRIVSPWPSVRPSCVICCARWAFLHSSCCSIAIEFVRDNGKASRSRHRPGEVCLN